MTLEDIFLTHKKTNELLIADSQPIPSGQDIIINNKAYYVMLFAQFERFIDDLIESAIKLR